MPSAVLLNGIWRQIVPPITAPVVVTYTGQPRQYVATAASVPSGNIRPSGANILQFEDLTPKANIGATVDQVTQNQYVSFDAGVFEFIDFNSVNTNYGMCVLTARGVRGSGPDFTTFRMKANTSTRAGAVPASNPPTSNGQTNPLRLMRVGWEQLGTPRYVSGFTLEGTPQGHLHGGLIMYYAAAASLVEDVRIKGIPGNLSREPGETFSCELLRAGGTSAFPVTVRRVEIDGINSAGAMVAASGFGVNYGSYLVFEDTVAHDMAYAHAYALYETSNLTFTRAKALRTALNGFNFENVSGTVDLDQCEMKSNGGYHVGIFTNKGNCIYTITDPVFDGTKLRVRCTGYGGQARTQNLADIHLIVGGVERPDLMTITTT